MPLPLSLHSGGGKYIVCFVFVVDITCLTFLSLSSFAITNAKQIQINNTTTTTNNNNNNNTTIIINRPSSFIVHCQTSGINNRGAIKFYANTTINHSSRRELTPIAVPLPPVMPSSSRRR